jgi:hypothetical protein
LSGVDVSCGHIVLLLWKTTFKILITIYGVKHSAQSRTVRVTALIRQCIYARGSKCSVSDISDESGADKQPIQSTHMRSSVWNLRILKRKSNVKNHETLLARLSVALGPVLGQTPLHGRLMLELNACRDEETSSNCLWVGGGGGHVCLCVHARACV